MWSACDMVGTQQTSLPILILLPSGPCWNLGWTWHFLSLASGSCDPRSYSGKIIFFLIRTWEYRKHVSANPHRSRASVWEISLFPGCVILLQGAGGGQLDNRRTATVSTHLPHQGSTGLGIWHEQLGYKPAATERSPSCLPVLGWGWWVFTSHQYSRPWASGLGLAGGVTGRKFMWPWPPPPRHIAVSCLCAQASLRSQFSSPPPHPPASSFLNPSLISIFSGVLFFAHSSLYSWS